MIKVLHLITDLNTGGAEMMLYKLISHMDKSRFRNVVVSMTDMGTLGSQIKAFGISVFTLGMDFGKPNPIGLLRLLKLLRRERPQILQTWLYHSDLLGLLAGKLSGVPKIVWNLRCSILDMRHYSKLSAMVIQVCAKLSKFPDIVTANSLAGRHFHENIGYHPKQWEMVPNGFDLNKFCPAPTAHMNLRKELNLSANALLIGFIARFDPMKDHPNFLKAARLLLDSYPPSVDIHFVLAGSNVDNNNKELTTIISGLQLERHVHLLGKREDIIDVTAALDIASSSSYGEGFTNVIGEAMACGVPCTVTDVGDSAYIVGDTGKVVPPKNPLALAEAWRELIEIGSEQRHALGIKARQRIKDNFSLDTVVKRYEALYEEVIASGKNI